MGIQSFGIPERCCMDCTRCNRFLTRKSSVMLKTLFSCLMVLAFSGTLLAQTSDDLKKKQADIQREIDELRESLNDTKKNKKAGLGQLSLITKKLRLREQAINNINDQINVIQSNIHQSRNEISRLKQELDTLKNQYEKSVVYAYKNRSNYDFLNFIFSASNFNDALKRIEYLKSYRQYREQQATSIKSTQLLLQGKITGLESTQKRKSDALQEQQKEKVVLVEERKEKDDIVNKLKARERELTKELTDKQRADKKLRDGIMAAIRRETEKAKAEARRREKEEAAAAAAAAKRLLLPMLLLPRPIRIQRLLLLQLPANRPPLSIKVYLKPHQKVC